MKQLRFVHCDPYHPNEAQAVERFFELRQQIFTGNKGLHSRFDLSVAADKNCGFLLAMLGDDVVGGVRALQYTGLRDIPQLQRVIPHLSDRQREFLPLLEGKKVLYVDHNVTDTTKLHHTGIGGMEILGGILRELVAIGKEQEADIILLAPTTRLAGVLRYAGRAQRFSLADWGQVRVPNVEGKVMDKHLLGIVLDDELQQQLQPFSTAGQTACPT